MSKHVQTSIYRKKKEIKQLNNCVSYLENWNKEKIKKKQCQDRFIIIRYVKTLFCILKKIMPLHSLTTSIQQTTIRIRRFINRHLITIQSRYEHHGDEKWSSVIRVMYEYFCIMDNIDSLATSLYENRYISRFWEVDQQVRSQNDSRKFVVTQFNIDKKKKEKQKKQ